MSKQQNTRATYNKHLEEKAERRGTGFVGFLSDLDWTLSLELEEGKPLDETKITTAQKLYYFGQGLSFGGIMHGLVLFGLSFAFYLWIFSAGVENEYLIHSIFWIITAFGFGMKVIIPLWILDEYYTFPFGVTYTILAWFIYGYSLGLFIPEFIYSVILTILGFGYLILKDLPYEWMFKATVFIQKYLPQYADIRWIPFHFFMAFLSFLPNVVLFIYRKRHPVKKYKWLPLNHIPEDD